MGTTSQHQLAVFSSPVNGTSPIDANVVKGNDNSIRSSYNAHDADTTIHVQNGLVASRPSASTAGQMWLASDTSAVYLYLDTGSAWVDASYLKLSGGTLTGGLTISSGGLTVSSGTTAVQALTATTGTFSGLITAAGGIVLTGGPGTAGTINKNTLNGLLLNAVAGSIYDFSIASPGGSNIISVPTGTVNVTLAGGLTVPSQVVTPDIASNSNGVDLTIHNGATLIATFSVANGRTDLVGGLRATGDLAINTNKFTVTAASGNTAVAGTLGVTGVTTHSANVIVSSGGITVTGNSSVTGTLGVSSDFAVATTKFTVTASTGDATSAGIVGIAAGRADYRNTATVSVSTSATSLTSASAHGSLAFVNGTDGTNSFFDVVYFGKNTASVFTTTVGSSQIDLTGTVASRNFTCVAGVLKLQMGSGTYSVSVTELRSGNTGA